MSSRRAAAWAMTFSPQAMTPGYTLGKISVPVGAGGGDIKASFWGGGDAVPEGGVGAIHDGFGEGFVGGDFAAIVVVDVLAEDKVAEGLVGAGGGGDADHKDGVGIPVVEGVGGEEGGVDIGHVGGLGEDDVVVLAIGKGEAFVPVGAGVFVDAIGVVDVEGRCRGRGVRVRWR